MEPILNEHEVIRFLVSKGGRCTNFELVSNFRGALNDPQFKADARLRFKDIINTVATVGEFQNVKYIELKKEHGLNNASESQPTSLTSDSSYTSPLTQNFQPYWRYRLSTSKQPRTYNRSVSEGHSLQQPQDDQVVPSQRQDIAHFLSGDFSDDSAPSLPFCDTRGRTASEPPALQRRFSSSEGYRHRESQSLEYQPAGHRENQYSRYQQHDNQPHGYQQRESQSLDYHKPSGYHSFEYQHQVIPSSVYQNHENKHQSPGYQHHDRQYQHHQNQPPGYRSPIASEQATYQHLRHQSYEDRNTRQQDAKLQRIGQECQNNPHELWNTGQQEGMQKTRETFSEYQPVSHQKLPLPDRQHSPADYQSQNVKQHLIRQQQFNQLHLTPHLDEEKQTGHRNFHNPMATSVQRSNSGRRSYESQDHLVHRTKPESSISRRIESLHGIRASDTSRDYSSLPYESPSAYSISDISPQGTNDLVDEDLQTSVNLRNVARALFKDPSKTSRRASYEQSPSKLENVNLVGLPNANHTQISNDHSISNQLKYTDNTSTQQLIANKGQGYGTVGLPDRPGSLSESPNPGHVDQGPIVPNRSRSMDSSRTNNNSNRSGTPSIHSNSNRTMDSPTPNHSRPENPRTSINSSPRPFMDPQRPSSSMRSNHSISMVSLDSEKELSNDSPPPPLPPDRRKKLPPPPDDNNEPVPSSVAVRERVQLFDQLEQQRRHSKRTHSPPPHNSSARGQHKGPGIDDDVSISVIEPRLKREWCVKCSQCDYHALSGLLKKEPKLAALKDTAMGYTALHWAAKQGDANVIKLIAGAYRVNPNIRSNGGYTPVHLATLYKHDMIVHLLVHTYGADPSIRDYSGKRADQYPSDFIKSVAGHDPPQRRAPLKARPVGVPVAKEAGGVGFLRIGSLNLRKSSRKSAVFASVRGGTRHRAPELSGHSSARRKLHKSMISAPERIGEVEKKNDSDSDSTYGFPSKKQQEN